MPLAAPPPPPPRSPFLLVLAVVLLSRLLLLLLTLLRLLLLLPLLLWMFLLCVVIINCSCYCPLILLFAAVIAVLNLTYQISFFVSYLYYYKDSHIHIYTPVYLYLRISAVLPALAPLPEALFVAKSGVGAATEPGAPSVYRTGQGPSLAGTLTVGALVLYRHTHIYIYIPMHTYVYMYMHICK